MLDDLKIKLFPNPTTYPSVRFHSFPSACFGSPCGWLTELLTRSVPTAESLFCSPPRGEGRGRVCQHLPQDLAQCQGHRGSEESSPSATSYPIRKEHLWYGISALRTSCFPGNFGESKHVSSWAYVLTAERPCFFILCSSSGGNGCEVI